MVQPQEKRKTGPLTKVDLCYIEHNLDKGVAELAKDLNRSETVVERVFNEIMETAREKRKGTSDTKDPEKPESHMFKLMGRQKRNNKTAATVMTPAASEFADSTRQSRRSKKLEAAIHKPLSESE